MERISLLIGLILLGSGWCQVFEVPEISSERDLTASAATLFGPKSFGLHGGHLGGFGPLGYGDFGGFRLGSIGPLHYGHIGGIHADSFLGASNPNADEGKSTGGTGTQFGGNQYQEIIGSPTENGQNIVGVQQNWQEIDRPSNFRMEQNYQGIDGEANFVGMEQNWQGIDGPNIVGMEQNWQGFDNGQPNMLFRNPEEQGALEPELHPQIPENTRTFLNEGLFGLKDIKHDKFEKIPPKPVPPHKFKPHKPPPPPPPPPPPHKPPPPPPPPYHYGGYESNSYGGHSQGHHHGSHVYGHSHAQSYSPPSSTGYRRYGGSHHTHYNSHSHGHGHSHKYGHHNSHGHKHGFNQYGGGLSGLFRSDAPEFQQQNSPQAYEMQQMQYEINNAVPIPASTTKYCQPYQPDIIFVFYSPQSRQSSSSSARSSVSDVLTGLDDVGFDFEFRDIIEDVFLQPYLGFLDPNDMIDDEALLLL